MSVVVAVVSLSAGLSADTKRDVHTRIVPPRPSCPVPKAGLEGEMRHGAVFLTMGAGGAIRRRPSPSHRLPRIIG